MKTLSIDIETYSDIPLQKTGVYRYCESPNFEILLFGYSIDSGPVQVVDLACGEHIPKEVLAALEDDSVSKWAFNAAFERVCLQHVGQIKAALGIAGVMTKQCAWRSDQKNLGPGERGAQIDLLIDRRDDTINICEMKWASEPYVIDKDYDEKLRNKVAAFIRETGTRKSILITMVTSYGVKENMYSDAVQSHVVMDDLFA